MNNKMLLSAFAVLALAGSVFAFSGFGMGFGEKAANVADSVRMEFMKAMHEGDYASAKSLNEEYGLGGRMLQDEETFNLRHQMMEAMDDGDYAQALDLQKQMGELGRQKMEQMREKAPQFGKGFQKANRAGGCQMAQEAG